MKTHDEFPRALLDHWLAEQGLQLAALSFPAGPTALPSQLATNPNPATGPVSTNVATATSPAINAHTPRAGASYHSEDV